MSIVLKLCTNLFACNFDATSGNCMSRIVKSSMRSISTSVPIEIYLNCFCMCSD